jgi:hypothetical protein
MFNLNQVKVEYPLPIPEELAEEMENPPDWKEALFQFSENQSLSENFFSTFSIESDGQIYEEKMDFKVIEGDSLETFPVGIEKKEYTGELILHGVHLEDKYDFVISFKTLFWKGDLKEIELLEWEKNKNTERVESQERAREQLSEEVAAKKKWWYKPLWYVSFVIRFFLVLFARILGFFLKIVSDIEARLAR